MCCGAGEDRDTRRRLAPQTACLAVLARGAVAGGVLSLSTAESCGSRVSVELSSRSAGRSCGGEGGEEEGGGGRGGREREW